MNKLKTKPIPAIVMMIAGLSAAVMTRLNRYPVKDALIIILVSMLVFLVIGEAIKAVLDRFELPDVSAVDENGEMIEKTGEDGEEGQETKGSNADQGENGKKQIDE